MKILISGDFCPIGRNASFVENEDYSSLFNGFEHQIKDVDYAIVNLECPITSSKTPIRKTGPCIKYENTNTFKALKYAGFDLLTLANNHIQDYGSQGVMDTINGAQELGLEIIGAGSNFERAREPLIKDINGVIVGFLNFSENEFCAATAVDAGAYTLDILDNLNQIKQLKLNCEKIILIYHGGREHYQLPTPDQRKRFRFFIEHGVDAIIAHHTHCFSGFEYYQDKPIVYSLGNFIFDYKKKYQSGKWTEGMSAILNLIGENFEIELIPHVQGREEDSTLRLLDHEAKDDFLKRVSHLSTIIKNEDLFMKEWWGYLETQEIIYLPGIYIKNKYLRFLFMKGLLPVRWLKGSHNRLLLNLMRCEAHYEISKNILNKT
jgi:poly-gamma-glutamate synthesis protein (capsule biosynthesis protein)